MLPADESPVSYSSFAPLRHLATTAPIPLAGWDSSRFAANAEPVSGATAARPDGCAFGICTGLAPSKFGPPACGPLGFCFAEAAPSAARSSDSATVAAPSLGSSLSTSSIASTAFAASPSARSAWPLRKCALEYFGSSCTARSASDSAFCFSPAIFKRAAERLL